MDKKDIDDLLNTLDFIAWFKSMLPFNLRGWVNALCLYVQERKAGQLARLQAGGQFRSYLDAWREAEGVWDVRKFDQETRERRFAHAVEPTYNIADYLSHNEARPGGIDSRKSDILNEAIEHFKSTQEWLWLPGVAVDLEEISKQMTRLESRKLNQFISHAEKVRENSEEPGDWRFLAVLYDLAARYKDMENALKTAYDLDRRLTGPEWMIWWSHAKLGLLYFAALSNSKFGQEIVVLGSIPSKPESTEGHRWTA